MDEAGSGDEALHHLTAALSVLEAFGAWSSANRVREAIVMANVQRGAYDEAERELKLTTPRATDEPWEMSMFDTAVRAEIALGRGDVETGLHLWRAAAAALRDPQRQEPGDDPSRPGYLGAADPGRRRGRPRVPRPARPGCGDHRRAARRAAALTADPGPPSGTLAASYDLAVCGSLLLALAMTDIDRGQRAADAGLARSGARMIALAERLRLEERAPADHVRRARPAGRAGRRRAGVRRRRVVVRGP